MSSHKSQENLDLSAAARKGRLLLAGAIVFSVFVNILMLTGPLFMLQVYDRVIGSKSEETLAALFILVALLYLLMALLDFARGRVLARIGSRIQRSVESRVLANVIRRAHGPNSDAALRSSLRDIDAIQSFYASPALQAVLDLPFTPIFFIAIFIFHPFLGWLGLAGAAILVVLALANQIITTKMVRRAQLSSEIAHGFANEAISGSETVRSQGMLENVLVRWKAQQAKALKASMFATDWTGSFLSFTKATRLFLQSAMLGAGAYLVLQNEITAGGMIAGTILLGRALAPVEQLIGQWNLVQRFRHARASVDKLLRETPVEQPKTKLPVPASIMQVSNLTIVPPGSREPTLRNVSFRVEPGQALGVIGRSGSGKSTLARAIVGLWPPAAGEIRLGGATLDQYDSETLGQRIGYLPQSVKLFPGTVSENIARMSNDPSPEAVVTAAQQANAHEMIMKLPKGYDTQVGEGFTQLSGGQMQRIALARALYCDPVILILDEPNSALDAEGSEALNKTVKAFKESERSVVVMTHRPTAISECDMLMVIEAGMTTDFGQRDEVLGRRVKNAGNIRNIIGKAKSE